MNHRILAGVAALLLGAACAPEGASAERAPLEEQVSARADVLTGAFQPGYVGVAEDERYPVRVVSLGELALTSGRLVLADPFVGLTDTPPLDLDIAPGRYPVDLAIADTGAGGQRVALARLTLSNEAPVRWSMAVKPGDDPATLGPDETFGYPVDAGTGGFLDGGAIDKLRVDIAPDNVEGWDALSDRWIAAGEAGGPRLGVPYLFALTERVGDGDLVMFSSGWGDGFYASWVGWDAQDRPVQVITDFAVIEAVDIPAAP